MGLFSRRRDDATTDSDESVLGRDLGDDALDEAAASGPWDLSELPEDQEEVPRIDLGSLQVPAVDGMQLRLEQAPDGTVTAGNAAGTRDMFGTAADALPQMLESATIGGKPADPADLTKDALRDLFDQLTDGQFTPLWQAIAELNGTAADPKAAFDLASKVLHS